MKKIGIRQLKIKKPGLERQNEPKSVFRCNKKRLWFSNRFHFLSIQVIFSINFLLKNVRLDACEKIKFEKCEGMAEANSIA